MNLYRITTSFDIGRRTAFWQKQVALRTYSSPFPNETKGLILIIYIRGNNNFYIDLMQEITFTEVWAIR